MVRQTGRQDCNTRLDTTTRLRQREIEIGQLKLRTLHIAHTGGGRTPPPPGETNEAAYAHSTAAAVRGPRSDTQGGAGAEQEGAEMHTGKWTVDVAAAAAAHGSRTEDHEKRPRTITRVRVTVPMRS